MASFYVLILGGFLLSAFPVYAYHGGTHTWTDYQESNRQTQERWDRERRDRQRRQQDQWDRERRNQERRHREEIRRQERKHEQAIKDAIRGARIQKRGRPTHPLNQQRRSGQGGTLLY